MKKNLHRVSCAKIDANHSAIVLLLLLVLLGRFLLRVRSREQSARQRKNNCNPHVERVELECEMQRFTWQTMFSKAAATSRLLSGCILIGLY